MDEDYLYSDPQYEEGIGALASIPYSSHPGDENNILREALDRSNVRVGSLERAYDSTSAQTEELYRRQREILDAAAKRILAQKGRSRGETLLALAAAMGQPTKTGRWGEALSNVAGTGAELMADRRKSIEARQQLADKYGLESTTAGLGMTNTRENRVLQQLTSEMARRTALERALAPKNSPTPWGIREENGRYYMGQTEITPEDYYMIVSGAKARGTFPYKTATGPLGPMMANQLPGAPGASVGPFTSPGTPPPSAATPPREPALPASAQPAPPAPVVPVPGVQPGQGGVSDAPAPATELSPEEQASAQRLFTPFAGLPDSQSLFSGASAPVLRRQAVLALRNIPTFPESAAVSGPQAVHLKAMIEEDAKRGLVVSKDLRDRSMASEDILRNYTKMYQVLDQGMRTGRIGVALTAIEEAVGGVLPPEMTSMLVDDLRKNREQAFDKWALDSATRTLKMIYGARITNLDLETAIKTAPGRSINEKASYMVMQGLMDKAQETLFHQQAWEEYRLRGGTVNGFEGWYRANLNPYFENVTRRKIKGPSSDLNEERRQRLLEEREKRLRGEN